MKKIFVFTLLFLYSFNASAVPGPTSQMIYAIQKNDYATVKKCLGEGANLDATVKDERTGRIITVLELALNNVNRNPQNGARIFNLLHQYRMDIHQKLSTGDSVITYAINVLHHADLADFLMKRGISIDEPDTNGRTALVRAVQEGMDERFIDYLLEKGANINAIADKKEPLFEYVWLKKDNKPLVKKMLERTDLLPKTYSKDEEQYVLKAVEREESELLPLLFDKGAGVDDRNSSRQTPIMLAIKKRNKKAVMALLDLGASVDARDSKGKNVFMYVAETGDVSLFKKIVGQSKPDINLKTNQGKTLLMFAVESGNIEMLKAVLNLSPDVNASDKTGQTAIMIAADKGNKPAINLLLSKGAKTNTMNETGQSALMLFAKGGDIKVFESMLKHKADLNKRDHNGRSVLWYAAQGTDLSITLKKLELLEEYGSDLSERIDGRYDVTDLIRTPETLKDKKYWDFLRKVHANK